ncbi:hypothetical protein TSAR_010046 [Trichomalopsis sarcophagae]|uniref:Uncharacterized protein n=1 Tax=Trichomalopsis sarcophagae TaxID=543379 RepID=A0A232FBB0_9HYME|nr:hypothetical protein TSAR_010046 [Trichomalopsis sarcophagae]
MPRLDEVIPSRIVRYESLKKKKLAPFAMPKADKKVPINVQALSVELMPFAKIILKQSTRGKCIIVGKVVGMRRRYLPKRPDESSGLKSDTRCLIVNILLVVVIFKSSLSAISNAKYYASRTANLRHE